MKKILITGANGQLGMTFRELAQEEGDMEFLFAGREDMDLLIKEEVSAVFSQYQPDFCINCAAYTAVDLAEKEVEPAMQINFEALKNLSEICRKFNTGIVHFSTDFVFDGRKCQPYTEEDRPAPIGIYGLSKRKGEEYLLKHNDNAFIIRTSWLYSNYKHNFLNSMIRLGQERKSLGVVFDQIGTPTFAYDLASMVMAILKKEDLENNYGLYHFSNEGVASWYDFAVAIMRKAALACKVEAIRSEAYPTLAKRPAYSVLDKSKIKNTFGVDISHWEEALDRCLAQRV